MNALSIVPAVLFVAGIGAIFISHGTTLYMMAGDVMIALAGVSSFKLSK